MTRTKPDAGHTQPGSRKRSGLFVFCCLTNRDQITQSAVKHGQQPADNSRVEMAGAPVNDAPLLGVGYLNAQLGQLGPQRGDRTHATLGHHHAGALQQAAGFGFRG